MQTPLPTTTFGTAGPPVTRLGLGLAALGRPGYINLGHADDLNKEYAIEKMRQHTYTVLDAARAAGVRYFDAARSYGRAEQFLAGWLTEREIDPAALVIGSKWGYTYTADWQVQADDHEIKEHSLPVLRRQTAESRANLGDALNIYHIHSATLTTGVLDNRPVLAELARLRADHGWIIGLSLSGENQAETLEKALEVAFDGRHLFASVQATWNLLERSVEPMLKAAHEAGWGVIVKEAVGNGRLTPRNPIPLLQEMAAAHNTTVDALAMAGVLARPWADVVLSGAATVEHLQSNLAAADLTWTDEMEQRVRPLVEPPPQYWQTRSNLAWN